MKKPDTKKIVSWVLIAVGGLLLLISAWKPAPMLIGVALLWLGAQLSKGGLVAFALLVIGGAATVFGFREIERLQTVCGLFVGVLSLFKFLASDIEIGKDQESRYKLHCMTYHLNPGSVRFYFMSQADDYIAIGSDGKVYSYLDGILKAIPTEYISRIEKLGLNSSNKSKYLFVRLYEKNGNYHEYRFSRTTDDFSHFVACMEAIIDMNENPVDTDDLEASWNSTERLFELGGVDTSIFPPYTYS